MCMITHILLLLHHRQHSLSHMQYAVHVQRSVFSVEYINVRLQLLNGYHSLNERHIESIARRQAESSWLQCKTWADTYTRITFVWSPYQCAKSQATLTQQHLAVIQQCCYVGMLLQKLTLECLVFISSIYFGSSKNALDRIHSGVSPCCTSKTDNPLQS